jgi:hypothetical protein
VRGHCEYEMGLEITEKCWYSDLLHLLLLAGIVRRVEMGRIQICIAVLVLVLAIMEDGVMVVI